MSAKGFDHFLITRFNLRAREWTADKNQGMILTDDWLEHRLGLFERYCLPSVAAQTAKDFIWLIYFNADTKDQVRQRVEELVLPYGWIRIIYVEDHQVFVDQHRQHISGMRTPGNEYVITTRVDNDDVIHPAMLDRVQKCFEGQEMMAVNFTKIWCLRVEGETKLFCDLSFSNHFVSVIEKAKAPAQFTGCYGKRDREWNLPGQSIQITDGVYCMELIHSRNLANGMKGFPVLRWSKIFSFRLKNLPPAPRISWSDFYFWRMPLKKAVMLFFR